MTSKEALGLLASRVQVGAYKEEMQKCFDIVNEALNKLEKRDTPMKPIKDNRHVITQHNCKVCNSRIDIPQLKEVNFCPKCGQRLDWELEGERK